MLVNIGKILNEQANGQHVGSWRAVPVPLPAPSQQTDDRAKRIIFTNAFVFYFVLFHFDTDNTWHNGVSKVLINGAYPRED